MSAIFESKSERHVDPLGDQADADSQRRAECAERISRLLSGLNGGPSLDPGKAEILPTTVFRETKTNPEPDTSRRCLSADTTGPLREFGSPDDASKTKNDVQKAGPTIVGVEKKSVESEAVKEQPINQPVEITGVLNSPNGNTAQELEVACVPGDSLRQRDALPKNSTVMRVVGKILPSAARTVSLNARPQFLSKRHEFLVLGNTGAPITSVGGFSSLTLTHAPVANYETINIHYTF